MRTSNCQGPPKNSSPVQVGSSRGSHRRDAEDSIPKMLGRQCQNFCEVTGAEEQGEARSEDRFATIGQHPASGRSVDHGTPPKLAWNQINRRA